VFIVIKSFLLKTKNVQRCPLAALPAQVLWVWSQPF